ncbi:SiaB family protein kinase [Limibacter armeniacum]|uniref:SiaB family protein kinase n=1 Tax=Limibacter armeniacum TaxID=466084 RepID=UPI002FE58FA7
MDNLTLKKLFDVSEYYEKLRNFENVIFSYKGQMSGKMLDEILEHMSDKLSDRESHIKLRRRVSIIAVEILQNVYHHYAAVTEGDSQHSPVIFMLGKNEDAYFIQSGNFVSVQKASYLKEKIDYVNSLSLEELKSKYREILSNGDFSEQGGAGLGIIDIVRKSGQPLDYKFVESDNKQIFFELKINVPLIA